jgi:UDP-N-acetylglucosamine acyltransferase
VCADVVLEDGVELKSHVVVEGRTRIGRETVVHPFACLGGEPQDKKHNPHVAPHSSSLFQLEIGRQCVIREHVTIHGSTSYSAAMPTSLGDNCWILCGAHVGHDVQIGSHVVLSNNVCVAGHVEIGSFAIIGGLVGLKQHIKIGSLAMVGGGSAVDGDVLPYGLASGNRAKLLGLNLIGLRRAKISRHQIKLMLRVVRYLFGSSLTNIAAVCPKTGFAPALEYACMVHIH